MMESMHYVNIFETKGLEYLLVISFLIGFVFLVRHLSYSRKANVAEEVSEPATTSADFDLVCPAGADCPHETHRAVVRENGEGQDKATSERTRSPEC